MSKNNQNPRGRRQATDPAATTPVLGPMDVPAPEAPVSDEMLMEATDAFVRAISQQDAGADEATAVAGALRSEVLAPFDAAAVNQAVDFLYRLGFLSSPAVRAGRRDESDADDQRGAGRKAA